jgi:hypothetical protein
MNVVNFVNFFPGLSCEPVIFSSLLCSLGKLIDKREFRGRGRFSGVLGQTPQEVHNVHDVHRQHSGGRP